MMNEDNAKTMVRTRRMPFRPAPASDLEQSVNVLPVGTHLGEFEILDLIGEGGFGIVYLAYDHSLERHVALKEYMPSGLATRTTSMAVTVRSEHNAATFTAGLKSFINEARMLAQFDSPSLVKVHRFWEGNGTAYMVMPFYEGTTLKQALKERRIQPTESWIRMLLADLFEAIETIHHAHCLHRDIAPDNILLLKDGRPLLLDFGAARRVIGDLTQCLTVILKPGFAPIEQYADIAGLRQGEWTDIYALAAVVYYLIGNKPPPPAVARMVHDELVPARKVGKGRYSDAFLGVIDKALSVKPEQRFRSIAELRHALDIMEAVPRTLPRDTSHLATTIVRTTVKVDPEPEQPQPAPKQPPAHEHRPHPRTGPKPSRTAEQRPHPRTEQKTQARPAPLQDDYQATRIEPQFVSIAPQQESGWRKSAILQAAVAGWSKRDKTEWLLLGLLLSAGIASGVYLGSSRPWSETSEPAASTSGSSAGTSSAGASGVSEADVNDKPATATAPSSPLASVSPRTSDTTQKTDSTRLPEQTQRLMSEVDLWRLASSSDKASDYEYYLREYPKGRYASLARLRLERKQPKAPIAALPADATPAAAAAKPPEAKIKTETDANASASAPGKPSAHQAEDELWTTATVLNEVPAYEAYLGKYPKGRYAALAKDKLAGFKAQEPAAAKPQATPEPVTAEKNKAERPTERGPSEPRSEQADTKVASIKPPEQTPPAMHKTPVESMPKPAAVEPMPKPAPADAAPKPAPETTIAGGKKTLKVDNQTMIGDFNPDPKTGIVSGTGKIIWSNGDQFEGTLVNGKKEGKGRFSWANGQRYNGEWARDMPNGKGMIVFVDGSRYEGDVRDGVPHGQGTTRFKGGDVYSGAWVKGKSHGQGRYTWTNGSYWEGEFRDDKRTDNGKMVFADQAPANTASGSSAGDVQSAERRASGKD